MTHTSIHCPVCQAEVRVADPARAAAQIRCGQCGTLFVPSSAASTEDAAWRAEPGNGSTPPAYVPPPAVIYGPCDPHGAHPAPAARSWPEPVPIPPEPPSTATSAGDEQPRQRDLSQAAPLGPPPPYRPIPAVKRIRPPPVEMAPAPAADPDPVNLRSIGALGPPPPYRPIVQAGLAFGRGPPPDLEPWRVASLARMSIRPARPVVIRRDPDEPEADWTLPREAGRALEPDWEAEEDDLPPAAEDIRPRERAIPGSVMPYRPPADYLSRSTRPGIGATLRSRLKRLGLFAAGTLVLVIGLGVALDTQRVRVMRHFPAAIPIYATFGLSDHESSTADSGPDAKCADQPAGCADREPEAPAK